MEVENVSESASGPKISGDVHADADGLDTMYEAPPVEFYGVLQRLDGTLEVESVPEHFFHLIELTVKGKYGRVRFWSDRVVDDSQEFFADFRMVWGTTATDRLLLAIGNCSTLKKVSLKNVPLGELESLLTNMQRNPVLESISVGCSQTTELCAADVERVCVSLGRNLQTSRTLRTLDLGVGSGLVFTLTAAGACHLASGLRGNSESALAALLIGRWKDTGVKHIAEIVLLAPILRELSLDDVGVLEDDDIAALGDALAQSTCLKFLTLRWITRGPYSFLSKIFVGEGSNQSITSLTLFGEMQEVKEFLPLLLSSTVSSLKHLAVHVEAEELSINQWKELGQSIRSNVSLERFQVLILQSKSPWVNSIETLLRATDVKKPRTELFLNLPLSFADRERLWYRSYREWKSTSDMSREAGDPLCTVDTRKMTMEVHLIPNTSLEDMWDTLSNAVSSEVMSISSLHLQLSPGLREGAQVGTFLETLQNTSTLRKLMIEAGDAKCWPGGWKRLFVCLRYNTTITNLELIDCKDLDDEMFKVLMGILQVNWAECGARILLCNTERRRAEV